MTIAHKSNAVNTKNALRNVAASHRAVNLDVPEAAPNQ